MGMPDLFGNHGRFIITAMLPNTVLAVYIARYINTLLTSKVLEASGGRFREEGIYTRCRAVITDVASAFRKYDAVDRILDHARKTVKKCGYSSKKAMYIYLTVKFVLPLSIFLISVILNNNGVLRPMAGSALVFIAVDMVIRSERKKLNLKFQLNAFRIYKYLHNQTTAGVRTTDAIKTVYEVVDDKVLKDALIKMAASFELTKDIDKSSAELLERFDTNDVQTLCASLKLGADTGDNAGILARQEELMFKKYFNYIQAETDSCRTRGVIAAILFTSIIVIMITIPLLKDVAVSVERILAS